MSGWVANDNFVFSTILLSKFTLRVFFAMVFARKVLVYMIRTKFNFLARNSVVVLDNGKYCKKWRFAKTNIMFNIKRLINIRV